MNLKKKAMFCCLRISGYRVKFDFIRGGDIIRLPYNGGQGIQAKIHITITYEQKHDFGFYYFSNCIASGNEASYVTSKMSGLGYPSYPCEDYQAQEGYYYMPLDSMWTSRSHGSEGRIGFAYGGIYASDAVLSFFGDPAWDRAIDSYPANALAKQRCVLYIGCSTGSDFIINNTGHNLVTYTYNKGAHFVLGTKRSTLSSQNNTWTRAFFTQAASGGSLSRPTIQSCIYAANLAQDYSTTLYYIGDTSATLK